MVTIHQCWIGGQLGENIGRNYWNLVTIHQCYGLLEKLLEWNYMGIV